MNTATISISDIETARGQAFKTYPNHGAWESSYSVRLAALKRDIRVHAFAAFHCVSALRLAEGLANTSVSADDALDGAAIFPHLHGVESSHKAKSIFP